MKNSELKPCQMCGKALLHTGLPLFWRVTVERYGVDLQVVGRMHGLAQFFGGGREGAVLAEVMGTDEQIAKPVMEPVKLILCEECAIEAVPIAALPEYMDKKPS